MRNGNVKFNTMTKRKISMGNKIVFFIRLVEKYTIYAFPYNIELHNDPNNTLII